MTYPQQPVYGQPPQGYPPQQQGYAQPQYQTQQAPTLGQPQQGGYAPQPPQGYPPVNQPGGYPPQQYQQQPPQAPPAPPMPPSTVRDFWDQPSSGGKNLPFDRVGQRYILTVMRSVTDADIQNQTDIKTGEVAYYRDGHPKKMMLVPVLLSQPTPEFPDGQAVWYVKGNDKNELTRAMEAAGIPADGGTGYMPAPRAGDVIDITYTHDKPMGRGMNPQKAKRIVYTAGNGIAPDLGMYQQPVNVPAYSIPQAQNGYGPPAPPPQPQWQPQQVTQQWQPQVNMYPTPGTATQLPPTVYNFTASTPQTPPAPDPAHAYQQATGQPMPPPQQYQQVGPMVIPQTPYGTDPYAPQPPQQQWGPTAPPAPQGPPPGAPSTAPAAPSYGPPADWPPDVPFREGLTVEQARMAALHNIPQPPQ